MGDSTCEVVMDNMTKPCTSFIFSKAEVEDTIVERCGLVCDKGGLENVAQSVFFTGCLVGVFLAGLMSDMMGKKVVCVILATTFLVSGVLGGLVTSWYIWLMLRFVVGAASIGMVTMRYIIQVEMIGGLWRSWANTFTAAEVAPPMEVTSKAAEEPAAPTPAAVDETPTPAPVEDAPAPAVAEEKPAEEKSEETKGNPFTNLCIFLFLIQLSVAAEEPMETEATDVAPAVTEPSDAAAATTEPKPAAKDTPAAEAPAAAAPEKTE